MAYPAKVLFDYEAVEATELSIYKDDDVTVEEVNDSGWSLVRMGDKTGWVPSDYVERAEAKPQAAGASAAPAAPAAPAAAAAPAQQPNTQPAAAPANKPKEADVVRALNAQTSSGAKMCHACGKAVESAFVVAKDKTFHADHFRCVTCDQLLGGKPFIEKDGKFYCENDYYTAFNPKCAHCTEVIKGQYISALDQSWHPDHFVCSECGKPFTGNQFRKHDNKPYCEEHFKALFAEVCARCSKQIDGQVFEALDKKFHLECFVCSHNGHVIGENVNFHLHESNVYCPEHFEALFLQKCAECQNPIKGQYLKVMDAHYHPDCWKCTMCKTQISAENCAQYKMAFFCKTCVVEARDKNFTPPEKQAPAQVAPAQAAPAQASASQPKSAAAPGGAAPAQSQPQARPAAAAAAAAPGGAKSEEISFQGPEVSYSYAALKNGDFDKNIVDSKRKEMWLADDVFVKMFGMSKAQFQKLPRWKMEAKRREAGLF